GIYTDIVEIVAPSSAKAGDWVDVTIKVKNIWTDWVHVWMLGLYDSVERFVDFTDWIPAGSTHEYTGAFIMPDRDVIIHAYTYYEGEDGGWYFDDEAEKRVSLAVAPEPYAGTISRMELEYDESRADIPAHDIPQGQRGLVHVWGRNDMSTSQKLGISWVVKDPDGVVVEEYSDWQTFSTGPGDEHEFIGGRFDLDKVGTYTLVAGLLMNPDAPIYVDTYYGDLCTVALAVPEPEFRAFEVTEHITA
ncbi:unnamed protein product, partial [marine sediment metagenome]